MSEILELSKERRGGNYPQAKSAESIANHVYRGIQIESDFFDREDWREVLAAALDCVKRYAEKEASSRLQMLEAQAERAQRALEKARPRLSRRGTADDRG